MNIYFILDKKSNAVKIGKANDISQRLPDLQTGNPNELTLLNYIQCPSEDKSKALEKELHRRFDSLRIRENGEWFHYEKVVFDILFEENIDFLPKEKRKPLTISSLYGGEVEFFGVRNSPTCYFYNNLTAQILDNYENSMKLSMPYRTMKYPTYNKQLLLPYSTEVDRVFISYKKHKENLELNKFISKSQETNNLYKFF